jgi:hypothetical protein
MITFLLICMNGMEDLEAMIKREVQQQIAPLAKQLTDLTHIDEMRFFRETATGVRDWIVHEAERASMSIGKFLTDKKAPRNFWSNLNHFLDYAHGVMHVRYAADKNKALETMEAMLSRENTPTHKHINAGNIKNIASSIMDFERMHVSLQS